MSKFDVKIATFAAMLGNAYKDEENREDVAPLKFNGDDLTEDFTAMLYAMMYHYRRITEDDTGIIGFTRLLNRLAIQHIMESKEDEAND